MKTIMSRPVEPDVSVYLHQKGRRYGLPVSTTFELTSRCNFSCRMCYIHGLDCSKNKPYELSAKQWLEIGSQAASDRTIFLLLTGGEPMIRSDFCEIYSGLKKLGFYISINTNASLISEEIFTLFEKDPPGRMNISLYGASDDTYERLCGVRAFSRVISNIERLVAMGIQVKLNFSITPYNCGDIEEVFAIAKRLGLQVKATTYMYPSVRQNERNCGENSSRLDSDRAAFYRVISDYVQFGREEFLRKAETTKSVIEGFEPENINEGEKIKCRAGNCSCWVDWKGNMSYCGMIPSGDNNVLEKGYGECFKNVMSEAAKIRLPLECRKCSYKPLCNICAAICYTETGGFESVPDYLCEFTRLTYKYIQQKYSEVSDKGAEK